MSTRRWWRSRQSRKGSGGQRREIQPFQGSRLILIILCWAIFFPRLGQVPLATAKPAINKIKELDHNFQPLCPFQRRKDKLNIKWKPCFLASVNLFSLFHFPPHNSALLTFFQSQRSRERKPHMDLIVLQSQEGTRIPFLLTLPYTAQRTLLIHITDGICTVLPGLGWSDILSSTFVWYYNYYRKSNCLPVFRWNKKGPFILFCFF